jgi:hypothetical protein
LSQLNSKKLRYALNALDLGLGTLFGMLYPNPMLAQLMYATASDGSDPALSA